MRHQSLRWTIPRQYAATVLLNAPATSRTGPALLPFSAPPSPGLAGPHRPRRHWHFFHRPFTISWSSPSRFSPTRQSSSLSMMSAFGLRVISSDFDSQFYLLLSLLRIVPFTPLAIFVPTFHLSRHVLPANLIQGPLSSSNTMPITYLSYTSCL